MGVLAVGAFGVLEWLEHRNSLRERRIEPKEHRVLRNLGVAGASAVAVQLAEVPVIRPLTEMVERRRLGLLPRLRLPAWLELPLAVVLMDYSLYWWHILLHRVPLLWRCHAVHHVDLELDASTALRFHFTELIASVPYRSMQVVVIGVGPRTYSVWASLTAASVMFHHSNIRLPFAVERRLSRLLVTPRLHGIHHSMVPEEMDSNYSSGLAAWDFLHRTVRRNVPQDEIDIGVAAYREVGDVTLPRILALPFREEQDLMSLPGGGRPTRAPLAAPRDQLLP